MLLLAYPSPHPSAEGIPCLQCTQRIELKQKVLSSFMGLGSQQIEFGAVRVTGNQWRKFQKEKNHGRGTTKFVYTLLSNFLQIPEQYMNETPGSLVQGSTPLRMITKSKFSTVFYGI